MSELQTVLNSLREYAQQHPLDVFKAQIPHVEHYREFTVRGCRYRICFTYQVSGEIQGYILSVYNISEPDKMPDESVCRHVADIIFPDSSYMDGDALNINVLQVSRKFIQFAALQHEKTTTH